MISASMGGGLPGNHAAATEPVATMTFSPSPQPSGSKARSRGARFIDSHFENRAGRNFGYFLGGPDAARDSCLQHQRLLSILRPSRRALSRASGVRTAPGRKQQRALAGQFVDLLFGDDAVKGVACGRRRRCTVCCKAKRSLPARTASSVAGLDKARHEGRRDRRHWQCGRFRLPRWPRAGPSPRATRRAPCLAVRPRFRVSSPSQSSSACSAAVAAARTSDSVPER